jgi:hypothetical protein
MSTSWLESCQRPTTEPAAWVMERLAAMGIGLEVDPRVRGEIAADAPNRTLYLSPKLALDWQRAHWRICRGTLFLTGGESWAPEFAAPPPPLERPMILGSGHAAVVHLPMLRRAW